MIGGLASPKVVVVHGGQVIVYERPAIQYIRVEIAVPIFLSQTAEPFVKHLLSSSSQVV